MCVTFLFLILFDGIKPVLIKDAGFRASFFAKKTTKNQATIVLVGGGDWGAYWGQELAKANYVSLSLPYHREKGLPALPEEIPLEYFEKTFHWLKNQPQVNPNKIIVMGASRNAELALILASYYPELVDLAPFDSIYDKDTGGKISKSGENYLTLNYERLIPVLLQAIKELTSRIEELENDTT